MLPASLLSDMSYEAVLFDVDGVLLTRHDSHPNVYHGEIERTLRSLGADPDPEEVFAFFGGAELAEMRRICGRHGIDFEEFWAARERDMAVLQRGMMERGERTLYDDCSVLPALAEERPVGLVSNNQHETIADMVERFGMGDYLATFYGRDPTLDGYRRMKPDPHYLERALADVGTREVLYVGDSSVDVAAAAAAGVDSAFIRRPHRLAYEPAPDPTYEIETLADLRPLLDSRGT